MSSLVTYAEAELRRAGAFDVDSDYDGALGWEVLEMVRRFAEEGHSGASAARAIALFSRVASYQPLTPLTGEPDEWLEVGDGRFQNKRCPNIFRENGLAYNADGKVFRTPNGVTYTSRESRVPVEFPYMPGKPEIVEVPE